MQTIKRNWLKKQIESGNVLGKCSLHLTDDYAFDSACNLGKTEWMPARISHPTYEDITLQNGNVITRRADDDWKDGFLNLHDYDFTGKSGGAYDNGNGIIHLRVHSNLHYELRIEAK